MGRNVEAAHYAMRAPATADVVALARATAEGFNRAADAIEQRPLILGWP